MVIINPESGTFTAAANSAVMSYSPGPILNIWCPDDRAWYDSPVNLPCKGRFSSDHHVLFCTPGLTTSECDGLDDALDRLHPTRKRTRASSVTAEEPLQKRVSSLRISSAPQQLANHMPPLTTPTATPRSAGAAILTAPSPTEFHKFPREHVCDMHLGMQALILHCNVVQTYHDHFTPAPYIHATVYRHRLGFRLACFFDIVPQYVRAGRTDAGKWSTMMREVRKLLKGMCGYVNIVSTLTDHEISAHGPVRFPPSSESAPSPLESPPLSANSSYYLDLIHGDFVPSGPLIDEYLAHTDDYSVGCNVITPAFDFTDEDRAVLQAICSGNDIPCSWLQNVSSASPDTALVQSNGEQTSVDYFQEMSTPAGVVQPFHYTTSFATMDAAPAVCVAAANNEPWSFPQTFQQIWPSAPNHPSPLSSESAISEDEVSAQSELDNALCHALGFDTFSY